MRRSNGRVPSRIGDITSTAEPARRSSSVSALRSAMRGRSSSWKSSGSTSRSPKSTPTGGAPVSPWIAATGAAATKSARPPGPGTMSQTGPLSAASASASRRPSSAGGSAVETSGRRLASRTVKPIPAFAPRWRLAFTATPVRGGT